MAGGGGGGGGVGGGSFDPTAWHQAGDTIGVARKLGSLDAFDVLFVRGDFQVCQLEFENENTKDYHYLGFDRSTNEGQYVTCIQEQSLGDKAYVAMEFTNLDGGGNVLGDCDLGIAGSGYSAAIAGTEANDLFLTSNHGMLLKGSPIKFMLWTGGITASETCRITDGALTANPPTKGGTMEFIRSDGGSAPIVLRNSESDGYIQIRQKGDVVDGSFGVTGSTWGGTAHINPSETFLRSLGGGLLLLADGTHIVRVNAGGLDAVEFFDNGVDSLFVKAPGATGRYTILELHCAGGANTGFASWIHFTNTAGQDGFITMPESGGGGNIYAQKDGFVTAAGGAGVGVRCNVNGANDSGWSIDQNGYMTIFAARQSFFGGTPVVKQAAVPDAAGGVVVDVEARAAINALLNRIRNYSLIVP